MFLDDPKVASLVFYPRKTSPPDGSDPSVKALHFKIDDDVTIGGIMYINDKSLPTILLFHGNGETAADYRYFTEPYFEMGVNLAVVDFRGYGFSTGKPVYSCLINDAMPIYNQFVEYLSENGFIGPLFLQGRSLGSVSASEIGSHNPQELKGIIFESGFASVYNVMTRLFRIPESVLSPEILSEVSNDVRIKKFQKPTLIIHGTNDFIISIDEADLIYESLPEGVEKKLVKIKRAGHNDIFYYKDEYFNPFKEFIVKYK